MEKTFEEIKKEKIIEAEGFFRQIGISIEVNPNTHNYYSNIPNNSEFFDNKKKQEKFHWTRLSINSDAGYKLID